MKYIYTLVITSFLFHLQCLSQSSSSVKYLDFYGTEISSPGKATYYIISVKTDSFYEKKTYFAHSDKIKLIEHFVNSKKTGNDTAFYEEGTIRYIVSYKNNKIDGELYAYYENKNIKYRSIITATGWKIVLGRGLDIFQYVTGDAFDLATRLQEYRQVKAFGVTYLRTGD